MCRLLKALNRPLRIGSETAVFCGWDADVGEPDLQGANVASPIADTKHPAKRGGGRGGVSATDGDRSQERRSENQGHRKHLAGSVPLDS